MEKQPDKVVIEGFMLKKKRKALQGYARRYFRLSESGSLSYAFNPNSPIRDSISVPLAFISASRKLRTLDIDGGNCVYHCKCLSLTDFDTWATALKAFINIAHNHHRSEGNVHAVGRQTLLAAPAPAPAVPADQLDRVYAALAKLSQPICDLELVAHELGPKTTQHQAHATALSTLPASSSSPQVGAPTASPVVPATPSSTASASFPAAAPSSSSSTTTTTTTNAPPSSTSGTPPTLASSSNNTTGGGSGGGSSKFRFLGKRSNSTSLHLHPHHAAPPPPTVPVPPHSPGGVIRSPTLVSNSTFTSASPSASAAAAASAAHRQPRQPERSNSTATTTTSSHSNPNLADEPDSWARQQLNDAISVLKATHAELIAAVQALPLVVVPSPQPQPGTQIPQVVPPPPKEQTTSTSSSSSSSTPPPLQTTDLDPPRSSYPSYPYPASSSPPGSPTGALNRSFAYQRTLGHTRNAPSRATTIASSSRASFVSAVEWNQPEASGGGAGGGSEYWYDAVPVPGEFVLDDEDGEGARGGRRRSSSSSSSSSVREASPPLTKPDHHDDDDERAAPSEHLLERRRSSSSSNTVTRSGLEDDDEEEEEAVEANIVAEDDDEDSGDDDEADGAGSSSVHHPSSPGVPTAATTEAGTEPTTAAAAAVVAAAVQRRKVLPHPVAGDEFSMLGMLRKNVGKDLSTISFPVTMNEPLSALQRLAEELEYSDLLDRAAAAPKGSLERLMFVAVFAVSGAAGNKYRSSRKPFNPLLGETYECIRPERGFRFVSEKVSHHPPVLAFHTEAASRGWQLSGHVAPNQKFWGRSMEIFVLGDCSVRFLDDDADGEEYSIRKPSSFVKNLVAGTKYIEIVGDLVVSCSNSKAHAVVSFKEGSSWGGVSTRNKIEGRVVDERGVTRIELVGRWDDAVDRKDGKHSFTRLWQIADSPPNPERYYGFSYFATTLNETTPLEAGLMAPTDSRLRPDQLALERGDVDEAERLKQVVEEKQRSKRKSGKAPEPKWFTRRKEEEGGGTAGTGTGGAWSYAGGYFETREKKAFEDPDIF